MPSLSAQEIQLIKDSGIFDAELYSKKYPDVGLVGIDPLEHFIRIGIHAGREPSMGVVCDNFTTAKKIVDLHNNSDIILNSALKDACSEKYSKNIYKPIYGFIDTPEKNSTVGHFMIEVAGWCYLGGDEIESVTAEIWGSGRSNFLTIGIMRGDVAKVYPNLKFYNLGFEGSISPSFKTDGDQELLVVARSCKGAKYEMRVKIKLSKSFMSTPKNYYMTASELAQTINGKTLFS
jgi:hypothetical protein